MNRFRVIGFQFLFALTIPSIIAAQAGTPAWILFQKAEEQFRNREYGKALELYGEALAEQPTLPEAQVGMARIYRAEADFVLAERFYLLAIDHSSQLVVPEDVYALRIELADMYQLSGRAEQHQRFREPLDAIVADDPVFSLPENRWQRDAMFNLLFSRGFDRVLVLYRLNFPQSIEAHRRLGMLELAEGNYDAAIEHILFAAIEEGGRIVDAAIHRKYDYQFSGLDGLFAVAAEFPEIADFIDQAGFITTLGLLVQALDQSDRPDSSLRAAQIRSSLQF